jgi:hypothetical protein
MIETRTLETWCVHFEAYKKDRISPMKSSINLQTRSTTILRCSPRREHTPISNMPHTIALPGPHIAACSDLVNQIYESTSWIIWPITSNSLVALIAVTISPAH